MTRIFKYVNKEIKGYLYLLNNLFTETINLGMIGSIIKKFDSLFFKYFHPKFI